MKIHIHLIFLLMSLLSTAPADQKQAIRSDIPFILNEYRLDSAPFELPFHLINGYILIPATVNDTTGKFLFDTATEFPFFFNRHYLSLNKDRFIAKGNAASGQLLELYTQDQPITSLLLNNNMGFKEIKNLPHADFGFLENGITRDFLGTLGYGFAHNYAFLINYDHQSIIFYPIDKPLPSTLTNKENVIATIRYIPTGTYGKMPQIGLQIGEHNISGFLDTGNLGTLELTEALRDQLIREGKLHLETGKYLSATYTPHTRARLNGVSYQKIPLSTIHNLHFSIGKENRIGLGYQFLKNYQTLWNYQKQTVTLLKR